MDKEMTEREIIRLQLKGRGLSVQDQYRLKKLQAQYRAAE